LSIKAGGAVEWPLFSLLSSSFELDVNFAWAWWAPARSAWFALKCQLWFFCTEFHFQIGNIYVYVYTKIPVKLVTWFHSQMHICISKREIGFRIGWLADAHRGVVQVLHDAFFPREERHSRNFCAHNPKPTFFSHDHRKIHASPWAHHTTIQILMNLEAFSPRIMYAVWNFTQHLGKKVRQREISCAWREKSSRAGVPILLFRAHYGARGTQTTLLHTMNNGFTPSIVLWHGISLRFSFRSQYERRQKRFVFRIPASTFETR